MLDRIESCRAQAGRAVRFRLAMLARRLHEQAIDRAQALLHRSLGRRTQRVDDASGTPSSPRHAPIFRRGANALAGHSKTAFVISISGPRLRRRDR